MSEWKEYKLKDALEVKYGKDHKKLADGAIPVYGSGGIMRWVNQSIYNDESILIPRKGTLSNIMYVNKPFWSVDTMFYTKINRNLVVPKYLFYQLTEIDFANMNVGSAVPSMTVEILNDIDIILPPLPEQERIAEVLSSLDDKIDLLQRNNKTLEQLAETLFRQWFVEEADMSNGLKLKDYVDTANTGLDAIKRAPIVERETGIKCLRIQDISQQKPFSKWGNSEVEENNYKRFQLTKGDIIMARTCSPGINYFVREDLSSVFNNGLVRIRANKNKVHPIFLYQLFKTRDFIGHIDGVSGGTSVQLNMQIGDLLDYDFTFIDKVNQDEIVNHFLSIDEKILYNLKQIQKLEALRDTLLPKLMNGIVRVEN